MNAEFSGVYAALFTPFDSKNRVDEKRMRRHVDFLISKKIEGLYICGGTGEGLSMDVSERKRVAETVKDQSRGRVKIIAHIGGALNTRNTVELAGHAERIGLDGIASIPPIFYRLGFDEIRDYFKAVAESTALPLFIYHIPVATGVSFSSDKMAELSRIPGIRGLKYTGYDFYALQDLLRKTDGKWIAFSGADEMFLPALTMGVVGCIGTTQNVLPEIFIDIHRHFRQGRIEEAMKLQQRITAAVSMFFKYGGTWSWKAGLKLRGIDPGYCRPPMKPALSEEEGKQFAEEWKASFPDFVEGVK